LIRLPVVCFDIDVTGTGEGQMGRQGRAILIVARAANAYRQIAHGPGVTGRRRYMIITGGQYVYSAGVGRLTQ